MASRKVTDLNHDEAKWFSRDEKNYVNFDLPYYFHFDDLLTIAAGTLFGKQSITEISRKIDEGGYVKPKNLDNVNCTVLGNKDGAFTWRPFQLIHPVLYVDLVNLITNKKNWAIIIDRFKEFDQTCVECISVPRVSQDGNSHKASQVMHWWEEMEQRSIKMALQYSHVFATDISNCYPSIYTHSIEWALAKGGREQVKKDRATTPQPARQPETQLGFDIDQRIQRMNSGQTNGIPQGSTLMDFIAEIVLGYGDVLLTQALTSSLPQGEKFHILRYRDDYKIFVNNPVLGQQILRELSGVLYGLNMKMNPSKTSENDDVILSSIKDEKLERIATAPITQHFQKEALRIYQLSKKYPNSGLVVKELSLFHDRIEPLHYLKNTDIDVLISIFTMIAISSPRHMNWISTIISQLLKISNKDQVKSEDIIRLIHEKFERVPNTGFIDIWLQRIAAPLGVEVEYKDVLTEAALGKVSNSSLWNCDWLEESVVNQLNAPLISSLKERLESKTIPAVISRHEVELFRLPY